MSAELPPEPVPLTGILDAVGRGDRAAHERLWEVVYNDLRRVAHNQMAAERRAHGLQTTLLVHEAYLRLVGESLNGVHWENRRHFFAAAAKAMRHIRIDDARSRARLKRGGAGVVPPRDARKSARDRGSIAAGGFDRSEVGEVAAQDNDPVELLALDEALTQLEERDPRKAEIVSLRYFAGLTVEDTAAMLGVSPRLIESEWRFARAWLHRLLTGEAR